jgi:hypothetical protein
VDDPRRRQLIERFIAAYNSFDIEEMLAMLAADVRFENWAGDVLTVSTTGLDEFRQLANQSKALFSEREQRIVSLELQERSALVMIQYRGRLAADLPDGLVAGTVLELQGTSEYFFRDGQIVKLVDRS